jgi:hypothetical protein
MNKKYIILATLLCIIATITRPINNIITFFIKEYPEVQLPEKFQVATSSTISKALEQPAYLEPKDTKPQKKSGLTGVWALHKGYARASSYFGQISFPRKQQSETVYIIITEKINPTFIVGPSTVGYWELDQNSPAAIYSISMEYDEDANSYYFDTKKIDPPEDNQISMQAIVIPGNPEHVYVPEGASITEFTANLTLPTIYIKKEFDQSYNASYIANLRMYFEQITEEYQENDLTNSTLMVTS